MSQRSQQRRTDQLTRSQPGHVGGVNAVTQSVEISYSGPLPPPAILREFEEVVPGSAQRIFTQFEEQSAHRREIESKVISSGAFSQRLGSISASLIGLIGVGGGLWLTQEGKNVEGLAILFGTLASLAGTFLYKKNRQDRERGQKQNPPAKN